MQGLDFRRKRRNSNNRKQTRPRRSRKRAVRGGLHFENGKEPLHFAQEKFRPDRAGAKDIVMTESEHCRRFYGTRAQERRCPFD